MSPRRILRRPWFAAMRMTGTRARWLALPLMLAMTGAQAKIAIDIPDTTPVIETNVRAFLSLTRYADRTDVTPDVMARLQRRIVSEARRALEPLGYYEPEVSYDTVRNGEDWKVTIHVTPGRPVRLSEVSIDAIGAGKDERALREVIEAQDLKPGLRLNHGTYDGVKGALIRAARNEGYLDAKLTKNDLLIDKKERRATVALEVDTGERYHYGRITTEQEVITDDAMRRMLRMKEGDPYTLDSLLRTQYVLDDSQYFRAVNIDSGDADPATHTVPITVSATPNRRHRYGASIGYATDTRARGQFTWDDRRVNEHGHRAKVELTASSVLNEIAGRYVIPVMDVALEKLEFTAGLRDEELGDTRSERAEVGAGLTQVKGRWQRVLFLRLSEEKTTIPANTTQPETKPTAFLIIPGISFSTLPSYVLGGKPRDYSVYAELRGSPATLGSDSSFLQFRTQLERIHQLSDKWSVRGRLEIGTSWVDEFSELPASQRFFAGGDRSVRGFGLNSLAPTDDEGNVIGGRNLLTGTVEFERALPKNFGVAAFSDFGNSFNSWSDPMLEYSAGLGVRFHIAIASIGIDVAQPLSESGRGPRVHLYMSTMF
ncbi:MAG TPA: BamA/TamA family outer membrane protein [Povalibacter sp.]|uniref:autotransporter assembly complex protein TamA n=1 Tax=Povalibacter sp. TaxID=1962978 RepID=UPI002C83E7DD|nr:BamA/TamA family outer membrane protein [Povalibacter sp.]HMN43573.1 BamA/TamA family outer membrane protein [Povalibacter sp.]